MCKILITEFTIILKKNQIDMLFVISLFHYSENTRLNEEVKTLTVNLKTLEVREEKYSENEETYENKIRELEDQKHEVSKKVGFILQYLMGCTN